MSDIFDKKSVLEREKNLKPSLIIEKEELLKIKKRKIKKIKKNKSRGRKWIKLRVENNSLDSTTA